MRKKLSQITIKREVITVRGDQEFEVRGINFADIMELMQEYAPVMRKLFNQFMESRENAEGEFVAQDLKALISDAMKQSPQLLFAIIALANDDPAGIEVAKQLPFAAQAEALEKICLLSIESDAELKKLQEVILRLIEGTTGIFTKMGSAAKPLIDGYGKSVRH